MVPNSPTANGTVSMSRSPSLPSPPYGPPCPHIPSTRRSDGGTAPLVILQYWIYLAIGCVQSASFPPTNILLVLVYRYSGVTKSSTRLLKNNPKTTTVLSPCRRYWAARRTLTGTHRSTRGPASPSSSGSLGPVRSLSGLFCVPPRSAPRAATSTSFMTVSHAFLSSTPTAVCCAV